MGPTVMPLRRMTLSELFQGDSSGCCGKNGLKGNQDRYGKIEPEDSTAEESLSPGTGRSESRSIRHTEGTLAGRDDQTGDGVDTYGVKIG